jgi:Na+-translocating ferredoxin:NAD+ oxidoreductase RnfG subunit
MAETKDSTVSILIKLTIVAVVASVILTATFGVTQEQLAKLAEAAGGPDKQLLEMGVVPDATKFKLVGGGEICYEAYSGSDLIGYGAMVIGDKVQKQPEFTAQFAGVGPDGLALTSDGGEIDGISGATISSGYVTAGVLEIIGKMQEEVS